MKHTTLLLIFLGFFSCAENLMDPPENLIPKAKMIEIFNDLAIVNAAKVTSIQVLRLNNIDPMEYIYAKHDIDSLQFVESDRYYASIPEVHEEIYTAVETKLENEKERITAIKQVTDSIKLVKKEIAKKEKRVKDSLQQIDDKKNQL